MPIFSNKENWPVIDKVKIERFKPLIKKRIASILLHLDEYNFQTRALLWIGAKVVLNRKLADLVMDTIFKSLGDHGLIRKN